MNAHTTVKPATELPAEVAAQLIALDNLMLAASHLRNKIEQAGAFDGLPVDYAWQHLCDAGMKVWHQEDGNIAVALDNITWDLRPRSQEADGFELAKDRLQFTDGYEGARHPTQSTIGMSHV